MIRMTTPQIKLRLPDTVDLTGAAEICVSFTQSSARRIVKTLGDEGVELTDGHTVRVTLTQEDGLRLKAEEPARVQVNWLTAGGRRYATKRKPVDIYENDIPEVMGT